MSNQIVAKLLHRVSDFFRVGPRFALREAFATESDGQRVVNVTVPRVGQLTIRPATSDTSIIRQIFVHREYDIGQTPQGRRLEEAYNRILASDRTPVILDLGANIGASARWFKETFPEARVIAVEPEPGSAQLCRQNLPDAADQVVNAAIGCTAGRVDISTNFAEPAANQVRRLSDGKIDVLSVSDVYDRLDPHDHEPFIVKIDIEGFEADLFDSNVEWVGRQHAIYIEPHDWMLPGMETSRHFRRVMETHNFDLLISGENLVYIRA